MFKDTISFKLAFLIALPFAIASLWYPIIIKIAFGLVILYFVLSVVGMYLEAYLGKLKDPEYKHPHEKMGWTFLEILYLFGKAFIYILSGFAIAAVIITLTDSFNDGPIPEWVTLIILCSAFLLLLRDGFKMFDRIEERNKRLGL